MLLLNKDVFLDLLWFLLSMSPYFTFFILSDDDYIQIQYDWPPFDYKLVKSKMGRTNTFSLSAISFIKKPESFFITFRLLYSYTVVTVVYNS